MSLINKLNNRCITNNFLKGDRGPIGPEGPPGLLPYYVVKSNQSSTKEWDFDLSLLPTIIRSSNGLEDLNISFSYQFIVAETASTLPSSIKTPSCGLVEWINAPSNTGIEDSDLTMIGKDIKIDGTNPTTLLTSQNFAMGNLLGKEVNITKDPFYQSVMYYCINEYASDDVLKSSNCDFLTILNSFSYTSSQITKNAYTIFKIQSDNDITSNKFLYLYLTPTYIFSSNNNIT